jgi:hypothetical protein
MSNDDNLKPGDPIAILYENQKRSDGSMYFRGKWMGRDVVGFRSRKPAVSGCYFWAINLSKPRPDREPGSDD